MVPCRCGKLADCTCRPPGSEAPQLTTRYPAISPPQDSSGSPPYPSLLQHAEPITGSLALSHTGVHPFPSQTPASPLQDATVVVVNTTATTSSAPSVSASQESGSASDSRRGGKRPRGNGSATSTAPQSRKKSKRQAVDWSGTPTTASIVGVGPPPTELPPALASTSGSGEQGHGGHSPCTDDEHEHACATNATPGSSTSPFTPPVGILLQNVHAPQRCSNNSAALDVWYFCRALETKEEPATRPRPEEEPVLSAKPKTPYVGCKLCTTWKVYKNGTDGGVTNTVRAHLKNKHSATYEAVCKIFANEWKHTLAPPSRTPADSRRLRLRNEKFTPDGFLRYLARWIAADDQSINVVESEEFQDLIFYLRPDLDDEDYPHRTKVTEAILQQWAEQKKAIHDEIKSSQGRVHYTCDIWSDQELATYLAVTAHHVREDDSGNTLSLCSHLIAFRRVRSHAGAVVADVVIKILQDADLLWKTGMFTLDNASSNDTFMAELAHALTRLGIPFDSDGNRIRCFPHVINIAVQHILQEITTNPQAPLLDLSDTDAPYDRREQIAAALDADPLGKVRSLVTFCRQSDQRRIDFRRTIDEGNKAGLWKDERGATLQLPLLQLLRDCETRWSSTFLMLRRVFLLYPAIERFLQHASRADISHVALLPEELDALKDVYQILEVAHEAQQLVSSERTPSLSIALPAYELVLVAWRQLRDELPHMRPYIDKGIEKIEEYVYKSRKSRIHALAIILNPAFKLEWIQQHWTPEALAQAEEWMIDAMREYRTRERTRWATTYAPLSDRLLSDVGTSGSSLPTQHTGLRRLMDRTQKGSRASSALRPFSSDSQITVTPESLPNLLGARTSSATQPTLSRTDTEAHSRAQDRAAVKSEFDRYVADGLSICDIESGRDLLSFWATHRKVYPYLYQVALDVLAVQASAVACERVFSSSKETDTLRRSRIEPDLMEALQCLKYHIRQSRLQLSTHLVAMEEDYTIEGPVTYAAMKELLAENKLQELDDLLRNRHTSTTSSSAS